MAIRSHIRKVVGATCWTIAGAGVLVLLVAAIRYRNSNTCKGWHIAITGDTTGGHRLFIDRKGITDLLTSAGAQKSEDRPIQSFDLRRLESALEKDVWIKDARLFFDNTGILQVKVTERSPIARIFTRDGNSFYVDNSGVELPLQDRFATRLPVFTDYPSSRFRTKGEDSVLAAGILLLGGWLRKDSIWSAQIAQIDITATKTFEFTPETGDPRIIFGDAGDIEAKFHRLSLFCREVLPRTGMDKYDRIDVSYEGEVIGRKRGVFPNRYDSTQGIDNIRQMIRSAQQLAPDTTRQRHVRPLEDHNTMTEQNLTNYDLVPDAGDSSATVPIRGRPKRSPTTTPKKP